MRRNESDMVSDTKLVYSLVDTHTHNMEGENRDVLTRREPVSRFQRNYKFCDIQALLLLLNDIFSP